MITQAREVREGPQRVHVGLLDPVASTTDQYLSQPTGEPNNPPLRDRTDRSHWHACTHLCQIIPTRKNLGPRYHDRRGLSLPGLAGVLGPLTTESATITPDVFTREPAPRKMSVKEKLEHLVKAEREHSVPGLK